MTMLFATIHLWNQNVALPNRRGKVILGTRLQSVAEERLSIRVPLRLASSRFVVAVGHRRHKYKGGLRLDRWFSRGGGKPGTPKSCVHHGDADGRDLS